MNPAPTAAELNHYYGSDYAPYEASHAAAGCDDEVVDRARRDGRFRHVRITPGMRILDVGCGGGYFLRIARRLGAEVMGVEPSRHGAEQTRSQGLPVFHGTVSAFNTDAAGAATYDLITLCHVLEHMPDPLDSLVALRHRLAPGGTLWVAVPNAACPFARSLKDGWHSADLPIHLMHFTPESLKSLAAEAGYSVGRLYTASSPEGVASSRRAELRRRWLVPARMASRAGWPGPAQAARLARDLDARGTGEAIIAEFHAPGDAR